MKYINKAKKSIRPSQENQQGGIVEKELSIHSSNVMLLHKTKPIKVGFKLLKNDKKVNTISSLGLLKSVKTNDITTKYNLVIICSGHNSNLVKNFLTLILDMSLIRLYFFPVAIIHSIGNFFGICNLLFSIL